MKILITCETYYPFVGGVSLACQYIAEGLAAKHSIEVATGYLPYRTASQHKNVVIREFNIKGCLSIGIHGEKSKYIDFLRTWDGDVMLNYAAQCWPTDLAMTNIVDLKYKKILIPCGYSGLIGGLKMRIAHWFYFLRLPKYLKHYDELVYLSSDYIDSRYNKRRGIMGGVVIGNGININEFNESASVAFRKKYGINTPYLLLTVSNHQIVKRHEFIIDAFSKMKNKESTLVILSSRAEGCFKKCKSSSEISNGRIILITNIPRRDVISAYFSADIFLFASKIECFPLTIIESLGAGVPFISTPCGNVPDLPGGIIIGSSEEMARTADKLLEERDYRCKLGEEGKRFCHEHFTWDHIIEQYEDLIERICKD
ncbi:MAG: glycosyltransferase family 4 protein [Nitrospirota bacterium]